MTDKGKFGAGKPSGPSGARDGQLDCAAVDLWLTEAAERSVSGTVQQQLRDHAAECEACRNKLERARRGREWLLVLKQEPLEPPADLVAKILAKTSLRGSLSATEPETFPTTGHPARELATSGHVTRPIAARVDRLEDVEPGGGIGRGSSDDAQDPSAAEDGPIPDGSSVTHWQHNSVVVLRRTLLEPRLALVAAMAFFSITLTLNLMGVRLTDMRIADLQPQNLGRAVTRQYAEANARVARYYENLRIVYEVESRVQQIRRAAQTSPQAAQTGSKPRKRSSNSKGDSSSDKTESHREGMAVAPDARGKHRTPRAIPDPLPVITGPRLDAAYRPAPRNSSRARGMICFSMRHFSMRERRLA
ncbi:MAG: hypothetical protein WA708_01195 [Acidobacteriaceae bacterium]